MELASVEPPAASTATRPPRELPELGHVPLGIVAAGEALEILANELVEALPHGAGLLAGAPDEPLIHGKGDIHGPHNMCARISCQLRSGFQRGHPHSQACYC